MATMSTDQRNLTASEFIGMLSDEGTTINGSSTDVQTMVGLGDTEIAAFGYPITGVDNSTAVADSGEYQRALWRNTEKRYSTGAGAAEIVLDSGEIGELSRAFELELWHVGPIEWALTRAQLEAFFVDLDALLLADYSPLEEEWGSHTGVLSADNDWRLFAFIQQKRIEFEVP